jgi:predicted DNA-binding transcriptional regulator YafY
MDRTKAQWHRVMALDQKIRDGEFPSAPSFAKEWGVSDRTIRRDIDFLRDFFNAPIEYNPSKYGYYYSSPCFRLATTLMSKEDLLALALGVRVLEAYRGEGMAEKLKSVMEKMSEGLIEESAPSNPSGLLDQISFIAPPTLAIHPEVWDTVLHAVVDRRQLRVVYRGRKGRIHPLHLTNLQGEWYLFVRFEDVGNFRQIAVGRIEKAQLLERPVNAKGFDAQKMLRDTFFHFAGESRASKIKLRFDADAREFILERRWHTDQKITKRKDGSIDLEFSAKGSIEVKRWVLAWGRHCRVLSPAWLREIIDEEITAMATR